MNLDNNYRFISDDYNFILQRIVPLRSKKRAGKTKEWKNVGYWKDVGQALASYTRQSIRDDNSMNVMSEFSKAGFTRGVREC